MSIDSYSSCFSFTFCHLHFFDDPRFCCQPDLNFLTLVFFLMQTVWHLVCLSLPNIYLLNFFTNKNTCPCTVIFSHACSNFFLSEFFTSKLDPLHILQNTSQLSFTHSLCCINISNVSYPNISLVMFLLIFIPVVALMVCLFFAFHC